MAQEAVVVEECGGGRRVLVEALHAHDPLGAVGGRRPPAPTVAGRPGGLGDVHVVADALHLVGGEDPPEVQEPGLLQEAPQLGRVVVEGEAAGHVGGDGDRPGDVHRPLVDQAAQDQPPVHHRPQVPVEGPLPGGHQPDGGDVVVDQVGQSLGRDPQGRVRSARGRPGSRRRRVRAATTARRPRWPAAAGRGDRRARATRSARRSASSGRSTPKNRSASTTGTSASVRVRRSTLT